jgi:hypothetical protein
MEDATDWQLELAGETVARVVEDGFDFPWTYAKLGDDARFDRFRTFFSDEDAWPDTPDFDLLLKEIHSKGGFVLRDVRTGQSFRSFRLNQEGGVVWFRTGEATDGCI